MKRIPLNSWVLIVFGVAIIVCTIGLFTSSCAQRTFHAAQRTAR